MKPNKLLKYLLIALILLIVFAVIGKKSGLIGREKPIKISTEKVERHSITGSITANGKIEPEKEVKITPDVSGEVVELMVKEGDSISKGQLLLKIKPDVYISQRDRSFAAVNTSKASLSNAIARLAQVKAQFEQIRLSYERNKKLWEQRTISQSEWEVAQSTFEMSKADVDAAEQNVHASEYQVKSAEASLKETEENLFKTSVYAPISGIVSVLNIEKGERVVGTNIYSGTEMLRVADLNRMEVKVDVNENDIVRVKLGDTAIVEVDAFQNKKFKGIVTEISNSANTATSLTDQVTNFTVKILLLPKSYSDLIKKGVRYPFRPGMSATTDIQTEKKESVIAIPIQAVTTRPDSIISELKKSNDKRNKKVKSSKDSAGNSEVIFLWKNNKAVLKQVKTGIQDNYYIEIISGLEGNEEVIVAPYSAVTRKLKDGSLVEKVGKNELFIEKGGK